MALYLSDEWLAQCVELAAGLEGRPGLDLVVQHEIGEIPEVKGKVRYYAVIADGRLVELSAGKRNDADVTVSFRYKDAVPVVSGKQHPDVAFMQGRLKVDGRYEALLYVENGRPLWDAPDYRAWLAAVAAVTQFVPPFDGPAG